VRVHEGHCTTSRDLFGCGRGDTISSRSLELLDYNWKYKTYPNVWSIHIFQLPLLQLLPMIWRSDNHSSSDTVLPVCPPDTRNRTRLPLVLPPRCPRSSRTAAAVFSPLVLIILKPPLFVQIVDLHRRLLFVVELVMVDDDNESIAMPGNLQRQLLAVQAR
jgi:hypothetical protein